MVVRNSYTGALPDMRRRAFMPGDSYTPGRVSYHNDGFAHSNRGSFSTPEKVGVSVQAAAKEER